MSKGRIFLLYKTITWSSISFLCVRNSPKTSRTKIELISLCISLYHPLPPLSLLREESSSMPNWYCHFRLFVSYTRLQVHTCALELLSGINKVVVFLLFHGTIKFVGMLQKIKTKISQWYQRKLFQFVSNKTSRITKPIKLERFALSHPLLNII